MILTTPACRPPSQTLASAPPVAATAAGAAPAKNTPGADAGPSSWDIFCQGLGHLRDGVVEAVKAPFEVLEGTSEVLAAVPIALVQGAATLVSSLFKPAEPQPQARLAAPAAPAPLASRAAPARLDANAREALRLQLADIYRTETGQQPTYAELGKWMRLVQSGTSVGMVRRLIENTPMAVLNHCYSDETGHPLSPTRYHRYVRLIEGGVPLATVGNQMLEEIARERLATWSEACETSADSAPERGVSLSALPVAPPTLATPEGADDLALCFPGYFGIDLGSGLRNDLTPLHDIDDDAHEQAPLPACAPPVDDCLAW